MTSKLLPIILSIFTIMFIVASLPTGAFAQRVNKSEFGAKTAITVGPISFTEQDLRSEIAVDLCYGDTLAGDEAASVELVGKALDKLVIKMAFGQEAPQRILQEKADWMIHNSKDSSRAWCSRKIFGKDTLGFYRMVVEPTLVHPRLLTYFAVDTGIQRGPRDTIQLFWRLVSTDPDELGKLTHDTIRIPKPPSESIGGIEALEESDDPLVEQVLKKLKPGQMWREIIEDQTSYKIVRLVFSTDEYYYCQILTVLKRPFDPWFQSYALAHIPVKIVDQSLEAAIRIRFPGVWWLPPERR